MLGAGCRRYFLCADECPAGNKPGAEQQTPAPETEKAPSDGTTTPKSKEDCEHDGSSGGTTSGSSTTRGSRVDNSRYF